MKTAIGRQLKLVLVMAGALALTLAASCSNNAAGLQDSLQQTSVGDSLKESSAFKVSTKISVTAKISTSKYGTSATFSVYGSTLQQGTLFFTDGTSVSRSFTGTKSGSVSSTKTSLWYCRAKLGSGDYWYFDKSGDYWYFDRSGTWQPSTATRFTSSYRGWSLDVDETVSSAILASDGSQVNVTFRDGGVIANASSGLVELEAWTWGNSDKFDLDGDSDSCNLEGATNCLCYVLTTADGAKWFFTADGSHIPAGQISQYGWDEDHGESDRRHHRRR
jgi:hypothetical protein